MPAEDISLERLLDALHGRDAEIGAGEALARLAASDHRTRVDLLAAAAEDPRLSEAVRTAAALALGRVALPAAERALTALSVRGPLRAQAEALRSLGPIGSQEALRHIDSLRLPEDDPRAGAARFAAALIAHRLGLTGHDLPRPESADVLPAPAEAVRPIRVSAPLPEEYERVQEGLRRYPYGIEVDPRSFVRLECAGEVNVICMNRVLREERALLALTRLKGFLGLVMLASAETGEFSPSYLLLSAPLPGTGRIGILGPRCHGRPGVAGEGELVEGGIQFALRAIRRPGARSLDLRGVWSRGHLEVTRAEAGTIRVAPRTPLKVPVAMPVGPGDRESP